MLSGTESQGLVYAKQKSGFYVAERFNSQPVHTVSSLSLNSNIKMNSLVFRYLKSIQSETVCPLRFCFSQCRITV